MKRLFILFLLLSGSAFGSNTVYISHAGAGSANGTSCSNAEPYSYFNSSANWSSSPTGVQIGPGTTVHGCSETWNDASAGDVALTFQCATANGTSSNPITLSFDQGATNLYNGSYWNASGAIENTGSCTYVVLNGDNNLTISNQSSGGSPTNGSGLANEQTSVGIEFDGCTQCTIENTTVKNIYINAGSSSGATDVNGANTIGITITGPGTGSIISGNTVSSSRGNIELQPDPNADITGAQIINNTISDDGWAIVVGGGDCGDTGTGIIIAGNNITNWTNWQFPTSSYHQDGIFVFNNCTTAAVFTGSIYDNYVYGNLGAGSPTGYVYVAENTSFNIFNNLIVETGSTVGQPGMFWIGSANNDAWSGGHNIYNNTMVANKSGDTCVTFATTFWHHQAYSLGFIITDSNGREEKVTTAGTSGTSAPSWPSSSGITTNDGGTLVWTSQAKNQSVIQNNVFVGCTIGFNDYYNGVELSTINRNVWSGSPTMALLNGADFWTYSQWLSNTTFDVNSATTNPSLTGSYLIPSTSSSAYQLGQAWSGAPTAWLTGAPATFGAGGSCGSDCLTRPSSGAVDAGAYPFASGGGTTLIVQPPYGLTIQITSSPSGISCPPTCTASYTTGTNVTLTATSTGTYLFAGWQGGGCSGVGTCLITLNSPTAVLALFSRPYSQLPTTWVDNNELNCGQTANCYVNSPGLSLTVPAYEFNAVTQTWTNGPPSGCTFHNPYWTVGTPAMGTAYNSSSCSVDHTGLQGLACDIEACRTAGKPCCVVDVAPGLYSTAFADGLVLPQTSTTPATVPIILRSASYALLPQNFIPCVGGIQDNLATSIDIGLDNGDCTGGHMSYQLGTLNQSVTAATCPTTPCTITSTLNPPLGSTVTLVNMTPVAYNTSGVVTSTGTSSFTFSLNPAVTGCTAFSESSAGAGTTVTATCTGFSPGVNSIVNVTVSGTTPSGYACTGCTVLTSSTNTFTYTAGTSGLGAGTTGTALVVGATNGTAFGSASIGNITNISPGVFTLANGKQINTGNYTSAPLWTLQTTSTGSPSALTACDPLSGGSTPLCQAGTIGPDHWLIDGFEARISAGNTANGNTVQFEGTNETSQAQLPSHIHLRHAWIHGDWPETAAGLSTGTNATSTGLFFGCVYCSVGDTYFSQMLRPGAEGHCMAPSYGTTQKYYHIFSSGCSIGFLTGGFSGAGPTIPGYVPAQDLEFRRNRLTFPYNWLGQQITGNSNWPTNPGIVRKNAGPESKAGERWLVLGNIIENVDGSGGQGFPNDYKVTNSSSYPPGGSNYQSITGDITDQLNIRRFTCNGLSTLGKSDTGNSAGDGATFGISYVSVTNDLFYGISSSNPGCGGTGSTGNNFQSANGQWTVNITTSGGIATATAICAPLSSGNCPAGPPPAGAQQMSIAQGDGFFITGCTGNTSFNSPTQVISGHTVPMLGWYAFAASGTTTVGSNTVPYVTFATSVTGPDSSGNCLLDYIPGWPSQVTYSHNTFVTDVTWGITSGDSFSSGPNYQRYALFRDSIQLGGGLFFTNSPGRGLPSQHFMFDWTTSTFDHLVAPADTSSYTELSQNSLFPAGPCGSPSGCTPTTIYQPTTPNCTGSTVNNCVGFTGAMSSSTMPGINAYTPLADYHGLTLVSTSPYYASGANDASDGTSMGANIPAIDTAQTQNIFVCSTPCGSGNPFPDNLSNNPAPASAMF